jgi:hypothetical protein
MLFYGIIENNLIYTVGSYLLFVLSVTIYGLYYYGIQIGHKRKSITSNEILSESKISDELTFDSADISEKNGRVITEENRSLNPLNNELKPSLDEIKFTVDEIKSALDEIKSVNYVSDKVEYKARLGSLNKSDVYLNGKIKPEIFYNEYIISNERMDYGLSSHFKKVFGERINHFSCEKMFLAKEAIESLENEILANKEKKYCLLIDSGTTMFNVFYEISERIKSKDNRENSSEHSETNSNDKTRKNSEKIEIWKNRVLIITNNLPGFQYLTAHYSKGDEYASLQLKCLLLPGMPLQSYAVAGSETIKFLEKENIKTAIETNLNVKVSEYKIISFIAPSYMVRHPDRIDIGDSYCPVTRERGNLELKSKFAELSDEIYLISPLTKFSFATCEQLNDIKELNINAVIDPDEANKHPGKVKYREIFLNTNEYKKKCTFFITSREEKDIFWKFAKELHHELVESYGLDRVKVAQNFKLGTCIPISRNSVEYLDVEIKIEIPDETLRNAYYETKDSKDEYFIWDKSWIVRPRKKLRQDDDLRESIS